MTCRCDTPKAMTAVQHHPESCKEATEGGEWTLMSRWMSLASLWRYASPSAVPMAIFTRAGHIRGSPSFPEKGTTQHNGSNKLGDQLCD